MNDIELKCSHEPIIVTGMHRSGTTLISNLMKELGVFMGQRKDANAESLFFLRLNEWLIQHSGASWDNPSAINKLIHLQKQRDFVSGLLSSALNSPMSASYLGIKKFLLFRNIANLPAPWGWKDPRNTITLPVWLDIFPNAKIIYVERHGIDVANSLYKRANMKARRSEELRHRYGWLYALWLYYKISWRSEGISCLTLEGALDLWDIYCTQAAAHLENIENPILNIRYESLLENPIDTIAQLARFCEVQTSPDNIASIAKNILPSRAFAFERDPELRELSAKYESMLKKYNYHSPD